MNRAAEGGRQGGGQPGEVVIGESAVDLGEQACPSVGNIYYSKYYELQGVLRDNYFFSLLPDAYQAGGNFGGLRCLFTEVRHLRDAMPFDTLSARMHITRVHEKGLMLTFDFFRIADGGKHEKLATGTHVLAWRTSPGSELPHAIARLPEALLDHLLARVKEERLGKTAA